ncbi:M23 family metallopeptidase [Oscillibacter sp. CU971]|uniref:M23 family metallopeptidase n=1 Tax=Oscillibacter sp. CU971 TaxID=2780102 RepID=UPI001FAF88CB|nr:M23 family metallopeptidase [Oscillibacter sp. CU971]
MANAALIAKAAATVLTDENTRKTMGWLAVAVLSPIILLIAFLCALASGTATHNISAAELCFYGGELPADTPEEYRTYVEDMRTSFGLLDGFISTLNGKTEEGKSLDGTRVKAFFYALYFGEDSPSRRDHQRFVDCFVTYEERTRMVPIEGSDPPAETEERYTVAIPVEDMEIVWRNIAAAMGVEPTDEQKQNAGSVYSLICYGYTGGGASGGGGFDGADTPFIGADGFCSPIGPNWRNVITSEFGYRRDPFTGKTKGHSGMDLAVPTGTPIRAALPGTVTVSTYNQGGYGYYVMIDHGGGLVTLYGHCSQLLARVGRTVEAGDVIALSGSTGRSTGPHLHFEVRVNGQRTNPRSYLP